MQKNEPLSKSRLALIIVLWVLTAVWFCTTWWLSSQPGPETGALSLRIASFIARLIGLSEAGIPAFHTGLRTAAHVIVFFVLSFLACTAAGITFPNKRFALLWPLLFCCVFAVLDEVRKAYIPGRHCSLEEAGLNMIGCVVGAGAGWLLRKVLYHNGKAQGR